MAKVTSAEAAKMLRALKEKEENLIIMEQQSSTFVASLDEDPESVRPEYDFDKIQKELDELGKKIRKLRHAINVFNSTTEVPGFGMTIDQILVYIPQLTAKKGKMNSMQCRLPKQRERNSYSKNVIDYRYTNYDPESAKKEYLKVSKTLADAQTALDMLNNSIEFELEI